MTIWGATFWNRIKFMASTTFVKKWNQRIFLIRFEVFRIDYFVAFVLTDQQLSPKIKILASNFAI